MHSAYIELRVAAWSTTKIGCPIPDARRSPLRVDDSHSVAIFSIAFCLRRTACEMVIDIAALDRVA